MNIFSPNIAYASVDSFMTNVNTMIINPLITLLFALAVAFFLYGMVEFLFNQANDEKKTTGKSHMLWGVVGLTVMFAVWAIMGLVLNTLGVSGIDPEEGTVELPRYE